MNTPAPPVKPDAILNLLRQYGLLKPKWVFTFLVLLLLYSTVGPWVARNYGLELPGITATQPADHGHGAAPEKSTASPASPETTGLHPPLVIPDSPSADESPEPVRGVLKPLGRDVYQSTAGLIYRPGSEEGHRIDHIMHHARDDLDKPVHGVFDGDKEQILMVIDEAWQIARKNGPPQVRLEEQGDRTTYTVMMNRQIGFKGGQAGQRQRNPALKRIKLVLEGHDVITAYPTE
ncbi:MAG: hypothetical protein DWH91_13810 [Planctomycetota bacterium]|nr:MAG: hypothetical protein DWH91_13810 [Planctomycetota bacterium]